MMRISDVEEIVRAVCSDKWDGDRISPSLFTGENKSVSRLAILALQDHWELFRREVAQPSGHTLEMIAQINVGKLQELGLNHEPKVELTVLEKPTATNPAHAETTGRITRGLASKIVNELIRHFPR